MQPPVVLVFCRMGSDCFRDQSRTFLFWLFVIDDLRKFYTGLFCESQAFIKTNKSVQSFVNN